MGRHRRRMAGETKAVLLTLLVVLVLGALAVLGIFGEWKF